MYFDSHAHYDNPQYDEDREILLSGLPASGVAGVINVGFDVVSSKKAIALAETYPHIYAAVGVHPHDVKDMTEDDLLELKFLSEHPKVVAIGEIGLDFHYDHSPRDLQRYWFAKQLELAKSLDIPVAIHSREASKEVFDTIVESGVTKGVLHCYSGHLPMALDYVKMGFYISLSGTVTYKNANKTREVAEGVPLNRLLIETDCPYLSPVPFRGKRNDSTKLPHIVDAIAEAKGLSHKEIAKATYENTRNLFGIS